jgi:hypothetical protein
MRLPNGLCFTRAATRDRGEHEVESAFQNWPDLEAAQRRRVEWRVEPPSYYPTAIYGAKT